MGRLPQPVLVPARRKWLYGKETGWRPSTVTWHNCCSGRAAEVFCLWAWSWHGELIEGVEKVENCTEVVKLCCLSKLNQFCFSKGSPPKVIHFVFANILKSPGSNRVWIKTKKGEAYKCQNSSLSYSKQCRTDAYCECNWKCSLLVARRLHPKLPSVICFPLIAITGCSRWRKRNPNNCVALTVF